MYYKYSTLDDVKKVLQGYINDYEARVKAWEAVTVDKKKNGEEFSQIGRAIKGAKIGVYYPVEESTFPYLTIYYENSAGLQSDHLAIYYYIDKLTEEQRSSRQIIYDNVILRNTSPMTTNEICIEIEKTITNYNDKIKNLKNQLKQAEKMFTKYRKAIEKAESELEKADKVLRGESFLPTSLYFAITATR